MAHTREQGGHLGLVSVVIPSHRGAQYLPEALASVKAQSHHYWEVLVIDDQSGAPASVIVQAFAQTVPHRRVQYLHGSGGGPGAARNLGIRAARGSHLAFLDEDDVWKPEHLSTALMALSESGADLAFSAVEMFDDTTKRLLGVWGPTCEERKLFPLSLYLRNYIAVLSVVMSRTVVDRHGIFDPSPRMRYGEDHDYWVRLALAGVRFVEVSGIHGGYRKGHRSGTSDVLALLEVHSRVHRRHLAGALARSGDPRLVRSVIAAGHTELALNLFRLRPARALRYALWALWITPTPGRKLLSAGRRLLSPSIDRRA